MTNFSLSSAIIGALITAVFAYLVRIILLRRGDRQKQRRLALLYLVRITQIVAIKRAIEFTYKDLIDQIKRGIKDDPTGYVVHRLCIKTSEAIREKFESSKIDSIPELKGVISLIKKSCDQDPEFGYKIDDQILSNLPMDVIIQYHFFIRWVSQIHAALTMWISAFESGDFSLLDPNTLYNQIIGFRKLVDSAEELRLSLIIKAKVKRKQATNILLKQAEQFTKELIAFQRDKKVIEIFKDAGQKPKSESPKQPQKIAST